MYYFSPQSLQTSYPPPIVLRHLCMGASLLLGIDPCNLPQWMESVYRRLFGDRRAAVSFFSTGASANLCVMTTQVHLSEQCHPFFDWIGLRRASLRFASRQKIVRSSVRTFRP